MIPRENLDFYKEKRNLVGYFSHFVKKNFRGNCQVKVKLMTLNRGVKINSGDNNNG